MLSRDQILNAADVQTAKVNVPEWGGEVTVRVLSGAERDSLEADFLAAQSQGKGRTIANFRARLCALAICDAKGLRVFDDKDIPALAKKSALALERVADAVLKLNRLTAAEVQELVGESAGGLSAASGSGSPAPSE